MRLVLDTNAYGLCETGNEGALSFLEKAEALFLPVIVYGELYYGFRHGARLEENLKRLDQFVAEFGVQLLEVDREVARRFGDIYASLRKRGRPIPTNDIWIAASSMSAGGTLLTTDRHFLEIPEIRVEVIPP